MRHTTLTFLLIAAALFPASRTTNTQSLNPPYLSSMPRSASCAVGVLAVAG